MTDEMNVTTVRKIAVYMPVTDEQQLGEALAAEFWRPRTQEELAEAKAYRRQRDTEAAQRIQANLDRLGFITDPLACKVLDFHSPTSEPGIHGSSCEGCPPDAEYGPEPWPCATVQLVADHLGIELEEIYREAP